MRKPKNIKREMGYDSTLRSIRKLAQTTQSLARRAVLECEPIVEDIICSECQDKQHIEQALDTLLDFCFDQDALVIYKKLCRYYYGIDPSATVTYVDAYREMWDSETEK